MDQQQFEHWLNFSSNQQNIKLEPEKESSIKVEFISITPLLNEEPLQPTEFLSQLPLSGPTLKARRQKHVWTKSQNQLLLQLHNQLGNRWSALSKIISGKSENDIKNHFFSQLRMSIRCLNKMLVKPHIKKQETIKPLILNKISNLCEEHFKKETTVGQNIIRSAINIKQQLFNFIDLTEYNKKEQFPKIMNDIKIIVALTSKGSKGRGKTKNIQHFDELSNQQQSSPQNISSSYDKLEDKSSLEEEISGDLVEKDYKNCQNIDKNYETKLDLIKPEQSTELIARPSFCLWNPLQMQVEEKEEFWDSQMKPFDLDFQREPESNLSHYLYPFQSTTPFGL